MRTLQRNARITIAQYVDTTETHTFEMQPIARSDSLVPRGFELLYRGPTPPCWIEIDRAVLRYLRSMPRIRSTLFVNLTNDSILTITPEEFVSAARGRSVVFEISEKDSDSVKFAAVVAKVNQLIDQGLHFAIDDFGSGRDGLQRLFSLRRVSVVKIDRDFALQCRSRADATNTLRTLISMWKASGIQVVIEGVDDAMFLDFARDAGADLVQGWHIDHLVTDLAVHAA